MCFFNYYYCLCNVLLSLFPSSVSGGLNALAAIFYTDIMRPYYNNKYGKDMNAGSARMVTRVCGKSSSTSIAAHCAKLVFIS